LSHCWKDALTPLRELQADVAQSWQPVLQCLEKL
jgi:hypothetical protein